MGADIERREMLRASLVSKTIYGFPTPVFVESLIHAIRQQPDRAKAIVEKRNSSLNWTVDDFPGISSLWGDTPSSVHEIHQISASFIAPLTEGAVDLRLPASAQIVLDRIALRYLGSHPEELSSNRILEPLGIKAHNGFISRGEFSEQGWQYCFSLARFDLDQLALFDTNSMSNDDRLTVEALRYKAETSLDMEGNILALFPANQITGRQVMLPIVFTELMPMKDEEDAQIYLSRLQQVGPEIRQLADHVLLQASKGYHMPSFACDKVVEMLQDTYFSQSSTVRSNPYGSRISDIEPISASLAAQCEVIIQEEIIPAHKQLQEAVQQTNTHAQDPNAPPGLHRFPCGAQVYSALLKEQTTTSYSPKEIHQIGRETVEKIKAQMKDILRDKLQLPDADPISYMRHINSQKSNPQFFYQPGEEETCRKDFVHLLEECGRLTGHKFNLLPKSSCSVIRVPAHMEKGAPAAFYWPPALDGSRPGAFYCNLGQMSAIQKYEMATLTAHEGVPGHHFQLALAAENSSMHILRRVIYVNLNAFWEGWALYAESLAGECGLYDRDAHDWLGHYGDALFRAARLVVDTGLHAPDCGRMSREQAIQYMMDNTTLDLHDLTIEVNRYAMFPAQACGYMLGKIFLERERDAWRAAQRTDIDFHDAVLATCGLPLDLVHQHLALLRQG